MSMQTDAQAILNALATRGRTDVPPVDHPGEIAANSDQKMLDAHARHMDAHLAHLMNKPAGTLTVAERTTLFKATLAGLQADGFCR